MDSAEFKRLRAALGVSTTRLAEMLGLGVHGKRTIERIEAGANVTGPMALAMQLLSLNNPTKEK